MRASPYNGKRGKSVSEMQKSVGVIWLVKTRWFLDVCLVCQIGEYATSSNMNETAKAITQRKSLVTLPTVELGSTLGFRFLEKLQILPAAILCRSRVPWGDAVGESPFDGIVRRLGMEKRANILAVLSSPTVSGGRTRTGLVLLLACDELFNRTIIGIVAQRIA
jgi:hypothetical protein